MPAISREKRAPAGRRGVTRANAESQRADAALVEPRAQRVERLPRLGIARRQAHRALELAQRVPPAPLTEVDPPEVHVGELARLVARGALGFLEPRDGLIELVLLHQVAADVVIRVAEVGIDLDRPETLPRGLLAPTLEAQRPPEKCVSLGRR